MDPKEMLAKRARVWGQMCALMDDARDAGRDLSAEEREQYDRLEGELDSLTESIERAERHADIERKLNSVREEPVFIASEERGTREVSGEQLEDAFNAYLKRGQQGLSPEHRELLESRWVQGDEMRAQGIATDAAGGYTVPEGFWNRIAETMSAYGGMLEVAHVIDTETGNTLPWPTNDDTGNTGAILAENTQVSEQDVTFGQRSLGAYTYTSKLIRVSYQLLQDSAFNVENFLIRKFGERLGRIHNTHFTTGTGTAQPDGIQPDATVGKTAAAVAAITWNELIDLEHSVDAAYRDSGRARYMFNDTTFALLRKLQDSTGRNLWQPSLQAGAPSLINGRPYTINNDMPDPATTVKSVLFGDFHAGYVIRRVKGVQVLRLTERYADYLQVGFLAFDRMDGAPDDTAAVKALQQA